MNTSLEPIVTLKGNTVFANSRDVAAFFEKQHKNVLRDIEALIAGGVLNFELTPWTNEQNGQTYRSFDMTRDGFTLLAMGFTGPKALQFKLAYIAAFNEMEKRLRPALPNFSNPVLAARAWADEVERKQQLQIENQRLAPLAKIGERAANHEHSLHRFVRTLPGVNTMKIKSDLMACNFLYKKADTYRVYHRFLDLFSERLDDQTGKVEIFPSAAGRARVIQLYERGHLTMKKGQRVREAA